MNTSFTFKVDDGLLEDFKLLSDKKFTSMSHLLRQYMLEYIREHKEPEPKRSPGRPKTKEDEPKWLSFQQFINKYINRIVGQFNLLNEGDAIRKIVEILQKQTPDVKLEVEQRDKVFNEAVFNKDLINHI